MAWGRPTRQTVVTPPPPEEEYQRPGGGLFGLNDQEPISDSRADMRDQPEMITDSRADMGMPPATTQYTNGQSYPEGYVPPAGDTGFPLDPSTATPMPFPSYGDDTMVNPEPTGLPWSPGTLTGPTYGDDTRDYGVPTRARNLSTQMVAGVPVSMAGFRPRLPGQNPKGFGRSRDSRLGLDRRAALLRALGLG